MPDSILLEQHQVLGAHLISIYQRELPLHYGDPAKEHLNVRNAVGIADISYLGKIKLTGKDRIEYLHNRLSNSIQDLKEGKGCYSTLLDFRGRMLSDLWVHRLPDAIIITTPPETAQALAENLSKFIFSEDVTIENLTNTWGAISVQGPKSRELTNRIFMNTIEVGEIHDISQKNFKNTPGYIVHSEWSGEDGYELIFPNEAMISLWQSLLEKGKDLQVKPFGMEALNSLRVEAGIAVYGKDMDNETIPLEANLQHAINMKKGCFPGQEILAKIINLSHPWRVLVGLDFQSTQPVTPKSLIYHDGKEVGQVTSSIFSPTLNKFVGLGYVRWEQKDPDTLLEIKDDISISAKVVPLPFFKRLQ